MKKIVKYFFLVIILMTIGIISIHASNQSTLREKIESIVKSTNHRNEKNEANKESSTTNQDTNIEDKKKEITEKNILDVSTFTKEKNSTVSENSNNNEKKEPSSEEKEEIVVSSNMKTSISSTEEEKNTVPPSKQSSSSNQVTEEIEDKKEISTYVEDNTIDNIIDVLELSKTSSIATYTPDSSLDTKSSSEDTEPTIPVASNSVNSSATVTNPPVINNVPDNSISNPVPDTTVHTSPVEPASSSDLISENTTSYTNDITGTNNSNNANNTNTNNNSSNNSDESPYDTNVDFSNFDSCINNKAVITKKSDKGKSISVRYCIRGYELIKEKTTMQNFAITDKYVYFSYNGRGAWASDSYVSSNGKDAALKKTSASYYVRITKSNNTYQVAYLDYAGHAQSFDVSASTDEIYTNYFAKLYKGSLGYGSKYVGVTIVPFQSNTEKKGVEILPKTSYYLSSNGKKISTLNSANYLENGVISNEYYKKVKSIASGSGRMMNPEVAVDESKNQIALVAEKKAYVYNLSDFKKGKVNLINKFDVASGKQGVDLSNGYLYHWTGTRSKNYTLKKYNVSTGKLVDTLTLNLNSKYSTGESNNGHEAEGMSIYQGKIYLGIQGNNRANDILLVEGF